MGRRQTECDNHVALSREPRLRWRIEHDYREIKTGLGLDHDDLPDPLLHELRACAGLADRRGIAVDVGTADQLPDLPVDVRRALAEPHVAVLTAAQRAARIILVGFGAHVAVGIAADADLASVGCPSAAANVSWFRKGVPAMNRDSVAPAVTAAIVEDHPTIAPSRTGTRCGRPGRAGPDCG